MSSRVHPSVSEPALPGILDGLAPKDIDATLERVAQRVAELVTSPGPVSPPPAYMSVSDAAKRAGRGENWIREHAARMGAVRSEGKGRNRHWKIPVAGMHAYLDSLAESPSPSRRSRAKRAVKTATTRGGAPLLPVRPTILPVA